MEKGIGQLVKAAAEGKKIMPESYDLYLFEIEHMMRIALKDTKGAFEAVCMAYDAGFARGHRATVRGRIAKKSSSPRCIHE